jgi:hypothetical protein
MESIELGRGAKKQERRGMLKRECSGGKKGGKQERRAMLNREGREWGRGEETREKRGARWRVYRLGQAKTKEKRGL